MNFKVPSFVNQVVGYIKILQKTLLDDFVIIIDGTNDVKSKINLNWLMI